MRGVSIVIPSWNGLELLKQFLPSVIESATHYCDQFDAPVEIVIVDDGSVDESIAWLLGQGFVEGPEGESGESSAMVVSSGRDAPNTADSFSKPDVDAASRGSSLSLRLIRNETNRGFGEACNRGFEAAGYPLIFLLNNDVEVDLNSIAPLVENFTDASVFAAHCRVFDMNAGHVCGTGKIGSFARGFIRVHRSYVPTAVNVEAQGGQGSNGPLYSMFAGGGSAMFDREKFLEIGGFEPLLSPYYWEDVELSYRAWKRGYAVLYEPRSAARHRISSTISRLDKRAVRTIEQRNRLVFHWINLHNGRMIASHVLWVLLLAATAPLRLKLSFVSSCIAALKLLPEVRKRRLAEKRAARRSDRDVFDLFASLERRTGVFGYDDYSELEEKS